jgi:hypothetical protein
MKTIRAMASGAVSLAGRLARAFLPTPGTTEGAVYTGMVLLAAGFLVAGMAPLSLLIPGAILVILGSLPAIAATRRGA